MHGVDPRGVTVTASRQSTVDRFEQIQDQFLGLHGDPLASVEALLNDDSQWVLGHCLKVAFALYQAKRRLRPDIEAQLAAMADWPMTAREQAHYAAISAWAGGDWPAAARHWERLLIDQPRDLLALKLCSDMHFFLGQSASLRDLIARVLYDWSDTLPGYGYVLGLYAFGLEECGDYAQAEQMAQQALSINRKDVWAIHARVHVMEMQGRQLEGISWLEQIRPDWSEDSFFAIHNWWHLALFHYDLQDHQQMLNVYDRSMRAQSSDVILTLVDAAALLWRLYLVGVDCRERALALAADWAPFAEDTQYIFNDIHALMVLIMAEQRGALQRLLAELERAADADSSNGRITRQIGWFVCQALWAFGQGDYDQTVEYLLPVRYQLHAIGGSHAQRDFAALTLLEAALRAGQTGLARALAAERKALKPNSVHNRHLWQRAV